MAEEIKKKIKRPTALKRHLRACKHQEINKAFKSRIRTAVRTFGQTLEGGDATAIEASLSSVYSMMDKGVKRGLVKQNKAARLKASFTAKARQKTA